MSRLLWKQQKMRWAVGILLFLICFSFGEPLFSTYSYKDIHLSLTNLPPSTIFWLGTDQLGRDILSCIALGGRITTLLAISAVLIDLSIGVFYGMIAGLSSKRIDECMMRFCDIFQSIPPLMFIILWICVMGQSLLVIILGIALTGWVNTARIMRNTILQLKTTDYILSAKAIGAGRLRIIFHHLLPNSLPPLLMSITLAIPMAIFLEAVLSFLHLGTQLPLTSWGAMIADGVSALAYYPWRLFFPSLFITLTMIALTLLSNAIKESFDIKEQIQ